MADNDDNQVPPSPQYVGLTGLPAPFVADVPTDPSVSSPPTQAIPDGAEEFVEGEFPAFSGDPALDALIQTSERFGIRPNGSTAVEDQRASSQAARNVLATNNVAVSPSSPFLATPGQEVDRDSILLPGDQIRRDSGEEARRALSEAHRARVDGQVGLLPHGFVERQHQVYHHEVCVYIQGTNVSSWLEGTVSIHNSVGSEPNTCELVLNNAFNRFTLTPENFAGIWRLGSDVGGVETEYDEREKKQIFDFKNPLANNPTDVVSGGRMWPLDHYSPIFHKMDPIRVWIRNPLNEEADQWMPVFTGYVWTVHYHQDHVMHNSTVTLGCKDIRAIMDLMRTNTNSVLFVQPGNILTENATQYSTGSRVGIGGGAFDPNFFQDLVVINSLFANPWANVSLFSMISALTYGGRSPQQVVTQASQQYLARSQQQLAEAERELAAVNPNDPRREAIQSRVNAFRSQVDQAANQTAGGQPGNANQSGATPNATNNQANQSIAQQQASGLSQQAPSGRGRIGRISRGLIYKYPSLQLLSDADDDTDTGSDDFGGELLQQWNNALSFGFPNRDRQVNQANPTLWLQGAVNIDLSTCTYWTKSQMDQAGQATQSNRAWAPDCQLVHVLKPAGVSSGDAVIQDNTFITNGGAVNSQLSFKSRLDMLVEACDASDYRFWITPVGDLVFEFPQYDFDTNDYNKPGSIYGWQSVLEYNEHMLTEDYNPEVGEAVTCVIAVGGLTGYSQFADVGETALAPEAHPHAVCWSPTLTMRHGVNIKTISLPLISDSNRLKQIAAMQFQRFLGQMSQYSIDTIYRPWIMLNRPILTRSRYALVESVTHTIPVINDGGSPTTALTLSYPRNFDQFGVPRFLSGGPSLPIFYGKIPGRETVSSRLADQRVRIQRLLDQLGSDGLVLSAEALQEYRANASFTPMGTDDFNIIQLIRESDSSLNLSAIEDDMGNIIRRIAELNAAAEAIRNDSTLTATDLRNALESITQQIVDLENQLERMGYNSAMFDGSPLFGQSGIRTTDDNQQPDPAEFPPNQEDLCDLDGLPYGSPLGRHPTDQSFPRTVLRGFSAQHQAVDYQGVATENVYAVADGIIQEVSTNRRFGKFIKVRHDASMMFSVYSPVEPKEDIRVGTTVYRNQVLGTLLPGPEAADFGVDVLHFSLGQSRPIPSGSRNRGAPPKFEVPSVFPIAASQMTSTPRGSFYASFADNRGNQSNAQPTRIHGGFDIGCPIGTPVRSTTAGVVHKVHTNNGTTDAEEGFGVQIKDIYGALHGYFHFVSLPPENIQEGRTVRAGDLLGYVGSTGRSGGSHLHYQITLGYSTYTDPNGQVGRSPLRVDVGPRLAALFLGLAVNARICKQEAASVYQKETGQKQPKLPIPEDSPESPVDGISVVAIYQRAGIQGATNSPDASQYQVTYFNTAIPDNTLGVPYNALPQIPSSDDLTFAILGDADAGSLAATLGGSIGAYLGRTVSVANKSVPGSTLYQWLDTQDVARQRRGGAARTRRANIDEARTIAGNYDVIIVALGASETLPQGMDPSSIAALDSVLKSSNSVVIWCTQLPYPGSKVTANGQTINTLLNAGASRENADTHVNAALRAASASVSVANSTSRNVGDVTNYYQSNLTTYSSSGSNLVAAILAPQIISILRSARSQNDVAPVNVSVWANAVPPEDCPPLNQRRLQGQTPADGIGAADAPQVDAATAPVPSTSTPPQQARS